MLEDITAANIDIHLQELPPAGKSPLLRCLKKLSGHRDNAAYCERLLANYEVDAEKELGRSRTFIKLGPMLGLMGTLIPMGPALVGLATTVVGMVIASVGVITLQVKQRWYAREMNDLEYLYRMLVGKTSGSSQNM